MDFNFVEVVDTEDIIKQTVQNMIEAGRLKPEESSKFIDYLQQLDIVGLLKVLVISHNLREEFKDLPAAVERATQSYPIDIEAISKN